VEEANESTKNLSRGLFSNDGGNTWHARPALAFDPDHAPATAPNDYL